jgi:hypothetical protein
MAYIISIPDLRKVMYEEISDEISRGDNDILQSAIDAALAEAQGYLAKYDLDKLIGTPSTNATVTDANLKLKLLDLAKWQLTNLANPNFDYENARIRYEQAIAHYFKEILKGNLTPRNWPYLDTSQLPAPPKGDDIEWRSNKKRNNHG